MKIVYGGGQISVFKVLVMIVGGLFAVWWLAGCAPKTEYITKTQFVDRTVETQVALDPRLTRPAALPPIPAFRCEDKQRRPSVCNEDMLEYLEAYRKVAKDSVGQVKAIRALQPETDK